MTEKNERWKSGEWCGSAKTRWQQSAGSSGGQSSADAWEHAKPTGKWTEVSADNRVLDAQVKEKENHVDNERQRKLEKVATNEKREERDRDKLGDELEAFYKERKGR